MATKTTVKKASSDQFVKALNPRDADVTYLGDEPLFLSQPADENRKIALARSFTWYGRFYGKKDAKNLLIQYLESVEKTDTKGAKNPLSKTISKVPEQEFNMTVCWLARMTLRGLELNQREKVALFDEIERLVKLVTTPTEKTSATSIVVEKVEVAKPTIQDVLREKAKEAAGELEAMFDDFITQGAKAVASFKPIDEVAKKNVVPQHISYITDIWKKKQKHFEEVKLGKDVQMNQGYQFLTATQLKNVQKFIELVLSDLNSYINVKKAAKKPRAKKAVSVDKIVSKMKYLKQFKDEATKLELVSVHPTKLHGASECFLFDTVKRKLSHIIADEYSKTFTVKGTTILGIDTNKSQTKTVRKPEVLLKELMKAGKPASRKIFSDIKAVGAIPNGRTNENMIILRAF
jgi:chemotaxis regulatin CheY-phosphate phosphatase CheZ